MKIYDKLVRDNIPQIIEDSGNKCEVEVLFAIGKKYGYSEDDILNKRSDKRQKYGGFKDNIILKKTW